MDQHVSRRGFLAAAVGAAMTGLAPRAYGQGARRPNILFLLSDDQRWDSLSCMGTPVVQTPNLDRMAREGVLFENSFCTTPICMASRASILSGQYVTTHGINDFGKPMEPEALAQTYPMLLREAGYRTGFIGKWGLGGELPADQFDYFQGFSGQGQFFVEREGEETIHLTRLMGNQIEEFLEGHDGASPFCLSVSFKAPHVQDQDPKQYLYDPLIENLYREDTIPDAPQSDPKYFESLPEIIRQSEGRTRWDRRFPTPERYQESVKGYYRLVTGVDTVVGRARAALDRLGLSENTIVIYTSDHGIFNGDWGLAGKWLAYEASIRMPFLIVDPRMPEARRGARIPDMALNIDMAPTMLDYAGLPVPGRMQGRSVRPLVDGHEVDWRTEWYFEHKYGHGGRIPQSEGVRTEDAKYVRYIDPDPPIEHAFDLERDFNEVHNLFDNPDTRDEATHLRDRWQAWHDKLASWTPEQGAWQDPV